MDIYADIKKLTYWRMREGSGDEVYIGEGEGRGGLGWWGMELLVVVAGWKCSGD